jgi:hypothetical protein
MKGIVVDGIKREVFPNPLIKQRFIKRRKKTKTIGNAMAANFIACRISWMAITAVSSYPDMAVLS